MYMHYRYHCLLLHIVASIGGFCEMPGDCFCRDGFFGENCTETYQQSETSGTSACIRDATDCSIMLDS